MMDDDRLEEFLRSSAQDYHRPPEPPRAEMWARIDARRRDTKAAGWRKGGSPLPRWLVWPVGIAAVLAIGVGIGRITVGSPEAAGPIAGTPTERGRVGNRALSLATSQHLSHAEAFITGFRAETRERRQDTEFVTTARALLSTTRLLLDSKAVSDRRTRELLEDLELTLVQIVQLPPGAGGDELNLITESLDQRGLLPRLRTATPTGPAGIQGEL